MTVSLEGLVKPCLVQHPLQTKVQLLFSDPLPILMPIAALRVSRPGDRTFFPVLSDQISEGDKKVGHLMPGCVALPGRFKFGFLRRLNRVPVGERLRLSDPVVSFDAMRRNRQSFRAQELRQVLTGISREVFEARKSEFQKGLRRGLTDASD